LAIQPLLGDHTTTACHKQNIDATNLSRQLAAAVSAGRAAHAAVNPVFTARV
jgi:hypothetical protein